MTQFLPFLVLGVSLGSVFALSGVGIVVLYRATGVLFLAGRSAPSAHGAWSTGRVSRWGSRRWSRSPWASA